VALSKVIPFNLADIGEAIAEVELVQWCVDSVFAHSGRLSLLF